MLLIAWVLKSYVHIKYQGPVSIFKDAVLVQYLHYIEKMRRYAEGLIDKFKGIWVENR